MKDFKHSATMKKIKCEFCKFFVSSLVRVQIYSNIPLIKKKILVAEKAMNL